MLISWLFFLANNSGLCGGSAIDGGDSDGLVGGGALFFVEVFLFASVNLG